MGIQLQADRIQNWLSTSPSDVQVSESLTNVPGLELQHEARSPINRSPDGTLRFSTVVQPTIGGADAVISIPDALGIHGETQIGLGRGEGRIMPGKRKCWFCEEGKRVFKATGLSAFSVDNTRPFGPLIHALVCSTKHRRLFSQLQLEDLRDSLELIHQLALSAWEPKSGDLDGLTVGQNYGKYVRCGASQPHFHYQVAGLSRWNYNAGDRLGAVCKAYSSANFGADYLGDYIDLLRKSNLILIEDEYSIAYSPISPRFIGEVQIMLKRPGAGNILDTEADDRDSIACMQLLVIRRFDTLKFDSMNQVWYTTRFSAQNDYGQRLVISLAPRKAVYAFYELSGNMVVDALPWKAAARFRGEENK